MKSKKRINLKLDAGIFGEKPVFSFFPNSRLTYLWVGTEGVGSRCFGYASGAKLHKFLRAYLKEATSKRRVPAKAKGKKK